MCLWDRMNLIILINPDIIHMIPFIVKMFSTFDKHSCLYLFIYPYLVQCVDVSSTLSCWVEFLESHRWLCHVFLPAPSGQDEWVYDQTGLPAAHADSFWPCNPQAAILDPQDCPIPSAAVTAQMPEGNDGPDVNQSKTFPDRDVCWRFSVCVIIFV